MLQMLGIAEMKAREPSDNVSSFQERSPTCLLVDTYVLISDWAFAMLAQNVVERFRHQRLKASPLTPGKGVHRKRHL
jgi:hypothetical protein